MKLALDCLPCFIDQVLRLARSTELDTDLTRNLMNQAWEIMKDSPVDVTPPEVARQVYRLVYDASGQENPLLTLKENCTKRALAVYPELKKHVRDAKSPLAEALKLAVAGNVIDFGQASSFDLMKEIEMVLSATFPIFDFAPFQKAQDESEQILYIADNAGETVFDRILIEELSKPVVYAVRDEPIQNDADINDALDAGVDQVAQVISSGANTPGAVLKLCNETFLELYNDPSTMVISKGQGNYEALSDETRPIFYLLKVKCNHFSHVVGVPEGSYVVQLKA